MAHLLVYIVGGTILAIISLVLLFIIYLINERRKYKHLPGPPLDNFIFGSLSTMRNWEKTGGFFNSLALEWAKKHGHVFKMNFLHHTYVCTCDPKAVREILITGNHPKPAIPYNKMENLFGVRFMGKSLVVETDQKVWVWRRALMNPCFQRSYLKGLEAALNTEVDLLITRLVGLADGKTKVSMLEEFNHITLDIIGKIAFGMEMNNVIDRTEKSEFSTAILACFKGLSAQMKDPFMKFRSSKKEYIKECAEHARFLRVFSKKCFDERREAIERGDYTPDDILNHLVKMKIDHPEVDEEVILDDITTFFVAGQETTACLLSFTLICLWKNKECMKRLRDEVLEIVGDKHYITMEDTNKMNYLENVIKETLRLYPPGASTFRQIKNDMEIQGYKIPANTIVLLSTFVSSRLEEFFPDPLKFDPDRFNRDAENKVESYTCFPFTLGPRTCIGKDFAMIEAKILLSKFVQRFDYEMDPDQSFEIEEATTLKPKGGSVCTLTLHDSSEN